MILYIFSFVLMLNGFDCVIYRLNDTEYSRLPELFALDDYNKCFLDPKAVYCTVRADLFGNPSNELIQLIHEYSEFHEKHYNYSYIDRGICVTKTCAKFIEYKNLNEAEDLYATVEACLNESVWNTYGIEASLSTVFSCHRPGHEVKKDKYDWIVAGMLLLLVMLNIIGSLYDVFYDRRDKQLPGHRYFLSFSIFKNWNRLTSGDPEDPRLQKFAFINGCKVLVLVLVVCVHTSWLIGSGYTDNPHEFEKDYNSKFHQLFFNGTAGVQIFFVISSFLLVYTLQIKSEKIQITWNLLPKLILFRWWRLAATSAAIILFTSTWLRHMGSGPLWDYHVKPPVTDCRKYWWSHIFFFNNYVEGDKTCAIHTWFIAADAQLFILGLIVYLATKRRGKTVVLTSLLLLGIVLSALQVWIYDLNSVFYIKPEVFRSMLASDELYKMYIFSHTNMPCYIVGMAFGYIVYNVQQRGIDLSHIKIMRYIGWLLPILVLWSIISCSLLYAESPRLSLSMRMFIAAIYKPVLGIVMAVHCLLSAINVENTFLDFLSWRGWLTLSRLAYIVYLIHFDIIFVILGTRTQLTHVSTLYYVVTSLGVVALAFLMAVPYFLIIEAPLNMVFNTLMFSKKNEALKITLRNGNAKCNGKKVT